MSLLPHIQSRRISDAGPSVALVIEALCDRIAAGEYPPGSRLPAERALAASLNVARNTLRAALEILAGQGLIMRRAGAGSFVTEAASRPGLPQPQSRSVAATGPLQLQVMRGILEPEMVRLAVINMPPEGIDALADLVQAMRQPDPDPARFARLEEEFHLRLAEGSGNPLLIACYDLVIKARRQRYRSGLLRRRLTPETMQNLRGDYAALLNAVAERDLPLALDLVQQMLLDEQGLFMQDG